MFKHMYGNHIRFSDKNAVCMYGFKSASDFIYYETIGVKFDKTKG